MTHSEIETVRQVAALARLAIHDDEAAALGAQFTRILAHFEVLSQLAVDGIEPMTAGTTRTNVLRDDDPMPSLAPDVALANAPARIDDFYGVPKTIGADE